MDVNWKFFDGTNLSRRRIRLQFADFLPPTLCDPSLRLQVVRERNNLRMISPLEIVLQTEESRIMLTFSNVPSPPRVRTLSLSPPMPPSPCTSLLRTLTSPTFSDLTRWLRSSVSAQHATAGGGGLGLLNP